MATIIDVSKQVLKRQRVGSEFEFHKDVVLAFKHMPGRHDQQRHAGDRGGGGTPVTAEWFKESLKGKSLLFWLKPDQADAVVDALIEYGVTEEELADLKGFYTDAPPGSNMVLDVKSGFYHDHRGPCNGFYAARDREIYISPAVFIYKDIRQKVIAHEVGHHVTLQHPERKQSMNYYASYGIGKLMDEMAHRSETGERFGMDEHMAEYGLRAYSLSSPDELVADSYMVYKKGSPEQRKKLDEFWKGTGMEEGTAYILKETQEVSVSEIQAEVIEDLIVFRSVPVVVSVEVVKKTPWYYQVEA